VALLDQLGSQKLELTWKVLMDEQNIHERVSLLSWDAASYSTPSMRAMTKL
jgi:hypothetical protein